jgi:DNA-binding IscR family transcriptional regulator
VVAAFESPRPPGSCLLDDGGDDCRVLGTCRLRRLFDEVDDLARAAFASTSLETLVRAPDSAFSPGG